MHEINLVNFLDGKITRQQVFDFVYDKIVEQGKPSLQPKGKHPASAQMCSYRGEDGCKCGIGHLLSDSDLAAIAKHTDYDENTLRARHVVSILNDYLCERQRSMKELQSDSIFICHLQTAHDNASRYINFVEKFKNNMKNTQEWYI